MLARMQYTLIQLQTQLRLAQHALDTARADNRRMLAPDYPPAKTYGEDIRVNHLCTNANRMAHYERKVLDLTLQISEADQ